MRPRKPPGAMDIGPSSKLVQTGLRRSRHSRGSRISKRHPGSGPRSVGPPGSVTRKGKVSLCPKLSKGVTYVPRNVSPSVPVNLSFEYRSICNIHASRPAGDGLLDLSFLADAANPRILLPRAAPTAQRCRRQSWLSSSLLGIATARC